MRPQSIGRVLGTGLRVAGRIAGQRMATAMASSPSPPPSPSPSASVAPAVAEQRSANASHRPARPAAGGLRRGASGLLRPFRRVGGIVWLEVTGSFFLLFALAFARALWSIGASWSHAEDRPRFLFVFALMAVFFYLGVSSFWRARKR
jgi:hypothetical protein